MQNPYNNVSVQSWPNNERTSTYFDQFGFSYRLNFYMSSLLIYSVVPLSFHSNFCQQIVFAKFNLTIFYYPPYMWLVWHYQQANTDLAKQAIELFDWKRSLSYLGMNKQVSVFNETIMNTFEIFVSHETITCNDKDPFCMNEQIKKFIAKKTFSINAWSEEC